MLFKNFAKHATCGAREEHNMRSMRSDQAHSSTNKQYNVNVNYN